jgi:hypothetical protein
MRATLESIYFDACLVALTEALFSEMTFDCKMFYFTSAAAIWQLLDW